MLEKNMLPKVSLTIFCSLTEGRLSLLTCTVLAVHFYPRVSANILKEAVHFRKICIFLLDMNRILA